jgi:hypothetical protein
MASVPDHSASELLTACGRVRRALAQVQCALFDLHEAFLRRDLKRSQALEHQTRICLDRIREMGRDTGPP